MLPIAFPCYCKRPPTTLFPVQWTRNSSLKPAVSEKKASVLFLPGAPSSADNVHLWQPPRQETLLYDFMFSHTSILLGLWDPQQKIVTWNGFEGTLQKRHDGWIQTWKQWYRSHLFQYTKHTFMTWVYKSMESFADHLSCFLLWRCFNALYEAKWLTHAGQKRGGNFQ